MGIASVIVAAFAVIFALVGTGTFMGFILIFGAGLGLLGVVLALSEFVRAAHAKARGRVLDRESFKAARSGFIASLLALLWSTGVFMFKGPM